MKIGMRVQKLNKIKMAAQIPKWPPLKGVFICKYLGQYKCNTTQ